MSHNRMALLLVSVAVAMAVLLLHWPCVRNGFLRWDDYSQLEDIQQHKQLSWQTVKWAFTATSPFSYYPLSRLVYALDYHLWGLNPAGYHMTSVVLHGLNAGLVVILSWMLSGAWQGLSTKERLGIAIGVGGTFGIHPLQVEPVAWFTQQMTLVCALFSLSSLCAYLRLARSPNSRFWRAAVFLLYVAALLSKPVAVSLLPVMLILDVYPLRRHRNTKWWQLLYEKVPLAIAGAATCFTFMVIAERHRAIVSTVYLGLPERCLVAARSTVFYLWKLMWPSWLSTYYPLEGNVSLAETEFLFTVAIVVLVTLVSLYARRCAPGLLAAWLAYLAVILPVSGLIQVGAHTAADRYMYLAIVPVSLAVTWVVVWVWRRFTTVGRLVLISALACNFAFWGFKTRAQIGVWHDDETLWRSAFSYFPRSANVNGQLALALVRQGRIDEAAPFAEFAAQANSDDAAYRATRGLIYLSTHREHEALAEFEAALRSDPEMTVARYDLACAYSRLGRTQEALAALQEAVARDVDYARLAERDEDLANLRNDPQLAAPFRRLVQGGVTE